MEEYNINNSSLLKEDQPDKSISVQEKRLDTEQNTPNPTSILPQIQKLLLAYRNSRIQASYHTPIHVDELASKLAKVYELIRKVIDWKEDNLLRRSATERILKRLLMTKITGIDRSVGNPYSIAETVTLELIRGGHLPNDEIPQESIKETADALKKYLHMLENQREFKFDPFFLKNKLNFSSFLLELASCEIEEILARPIKENGLLYTMTEMMFERIMLKPEDLLNNDDKKILVFIAVCRTLYDLDDTYIIFRLFRRWYPNWNNPTDEIIKNISSHISTWLGQINTYLDHPLLKDFYAKCERTDTVFTLLGDFLEKYKKEPDKLFQIIRNEETFRNEIGQFYDKRYITLKTRLFRLAIFSTLSVFLSNFVTFYIVEVPLAHVFAEGFNLFTAIIDFVVPSVAMFLLVSIIRPPSKANRQKALDLAISFIYANKSRDLYEILRKKPKRLLFSVIFSILYIILGTVFFSGIGYVFFIAGLPISSVVFDTITITLNVFAAALIRNKAKELTVDEKLGISDFLLDIWSLPVAKVGSFIANKWKEYNIVSVFFTFVIETPFVIILEFIEQWSNFIKERRAELRE